LGISSKTTFGIKRSHPFNAELIFNRNGIPFASRILFGLKVITVETFIHEVTELETMNLLKRWGYNPDAMVRHRGMRIVRTIEKDLKTLWWTGEVDFLSHLISPFGGGTLIFPKSNPLKEQYLYTRPKHKK
jgi:hypothetical protein